MVVGFSDNWLFDVGQENNSIPKFLVHAFFAFLWFSILVIQAGLISKKNTRLHMKLGMAGMAAYAGFFLSTAFLYITNLLEDGVLQPLAIMNVMLFGYGSFLIITGFLNRQKDTSKHKKHILIGTLMLMEPGISRTLNHIVGQGTEPLWLLTYLVLFGLFIWFFKRINWQLGVGFVIWLAGLANFIASMG